ncbi:MAG: ABC transporter permease [Actinobacteria bacterium]|jgi:simple sugar transport system permease protein|nr:ABC transporter permease [Actinomycetota bacterium]
MLDFISDNKKSLITLGLVTVIAYVFYFLDEIRTTSVLVFGWGYAVPLVLAAMVGIIGERSGVVNIGIEGQMLMSAFAGFFGSVFTGSIYLGMIIGILTGVLMGAFLAVAAVKWEMDQIIAGVVINIVAAGLTSFFYAQGKTLPELMPVVSIPLLSDIPLIGPVFFRNGLFALSTLFIVVAVNYALFKTRWGLRSRSVGEYPSAADAAGINVTRVRMMNVTLAGALAGCAGAFLALEAAGTFARGLTAGRGFLALAIMIFGAWNPMGALAAALFFGLSTAIASQLQADEVINIPQQFVNLLPFVMTLIVLSIAVGRVRPPAAAGQPYTKEG